MEAKAIIRNVRISPRKARVIANLIRGKHIGEAMAILRYSAKKAGKIVEKLLFSAISNAERGRSVSVDDLVVQNCVVDGGPLIKRFMPRSMGRANRIQHRTSHISVFISEQRD